MLFWGPKDGSESYVDLGPMMSIQVYVSLRHEKPVPEGCSVMVLDSFYRPLVDLHEALSQQVDMPKMTMFRWSFFMGLGLTSRTLQDMIGPAQRAGSHKGCSIQRSIGLS